MTTQDKYNELLDELTPEIKAFGFSRRKNIFYLYRDGNCGRIFFTKSSISYYRRTGETGFAVLFYLKYQLFTENLNWFWGGAEHWRKGGLPKSMAHI